MTKSIKQSIALLTLLFATWTPTAFADIFLCTNQAQGNVTVGGYEGCGQMYSFTHSIQPKAPRCQLGMVKEYDGISLPIAHEAVDPFPAAGYIVDQTRYHAAAASQ